MHLALVQDASERRPLSPDEVRALIRMRSQLGTGAETTCIELKRDLPPSGHEHREAWVKLLGVAVSMANSGGGYVLFGMDDSGDLEGIRKETIQLLDPAKIQDQLQRYSPNARLTTQLTIADYYGKTYAALWVRGSDRVLVFDKPGEYHDASGAQKVGFRAGVVYTRRPGGRKAASQSDLDMLVQAHVDRQLSKLVAKIDQVAHMPLDAELLASHPDNPNRAYRIVDRGEAQPVRITTDEHEPAVLLREVFETDVPYQATNDEVSAQVRFWNSNPDHRVAKEVTFAWLLHRSEVTWTAEACEFCLLSACHDFGYPMFWAQRLSVLNQDQLFVLIDRLIESPSYPEANYLPYLVCAFFWDDREELLDRVRSMGYSQVRQTADRLGKLDDIDKFRLWARGPAVTLRVGDEEHEKRELLDDPDIARRFFDRVVELRYQIAHGEVSGDELPQLSTIGHQLDVLSFTPAGEE